ncbi:MAG TPA: DUF1876 domain-containing protein [Micromonosporaceae bacterium]|nr:DUF1876 domain-containing protein [Micromonosporaceae bacterium]
MTSLKHWTVQIDIDEHDDGGWTHAKALLEGAGPDRLRADGQAQRHPADVPQSQVGDQLAVARALSALASQMESAALWQLRPSADLRGPVR